KIFWLDQIRNVEAYSTMSFWRGIELVKPSITCLNNREIISAAVLTRSAIELASIYLLNARSLDNDWREIQFPSNTVVLVDGIEQRIVKMIWGTRLDNPPEHLKQTNILTIVQKVSKNPKAKDILPL